MSDIISCLLVVGSGVLLGFGFQLGRWAFGGWKDMISDLISFFRRR